MRYTESVPGTQDVPQRLSATITALAGRGFSRRRWKISRPFRRRIDFEVCNYGVAGGGVGAAAETHLLRREVYFAFAEVEANSSHAYDERHRIGGGASAGMYADLAERWRVMVTGTYLRYALGEKSDDVRWTAGQRFTVAKDWAVRLEYSHRDHDNDVMFSVQTFF